jgi:hypothetical protein
MEYQDEYYEIRCKLCHKYVCFGQDCDPYTPTEIICISCHKELPKKNPMEQVIPPSKYLFPEGLPEVAFKQISVPSLESKLPSHHADIERKEYG